MHQNKRLLSAFFSLLLCFSLFLTLDAGAVSAGLTMRLATRTGPGTQYDESGSYFQNDWASTQVEVISAAWDKYNDIWWVQVDFIANNTRYRTYTGLKRVNVDIGTLYAEEALGMATMTAAAQAYRGPGQDYAQSKLNVPNGTAVTVYDAENGFVQVEFYDDRTATSDRSLRRAWVNAAAVSGHWISLRLAAQSGPQQFSFCPHCGRQLPPNNDFLYCPYCGNYLAGGSP